MRWEPERGLPVRRLPGSGRDSVFAFRHELERWQRSGPVRPGVETATAPQAAAGAGAVSSAVPRGRRRWLLAGAGALALGGLTIATIGAVNWLGRPDSRQQPVVPRQEARARASADRALVVLPFVRLELSTPGGWTGTVTVADGGAAQFGPSGNHPGVILRPRVGKGVLMLEIDRVDGRPVKDAGARSQPFVLVLDPDVTVQVPQPFPFFVRWVSGGSSPKSRTRHALVRLHRRRVAALTVARTGAARSARCLDMASAEDLRIAGHAAPLCALVVTR